MSPSRSPNSSSPSRGGVSGESARMPPSPNSPETTTATPMSPPARASRATSAIPPAATSTPAAAPSSSGTPGQRGDHEPGQHRVRERLRRVRAPQQQDPDAQRPAGEPEDDRLDERALHDPAGQHRHQWRVVVVRDADGLAGRRRGSRARRRRCGAGRRCVSVVSGAPNATWPWLRHSTRGHARACATSWVATSSARPSACSSAKTRSICAALGRSTPDSGSSSSSSGASCTSARAISTRWRWPPLSVPNRARACSASPTRASAASALRPVRARDALEPRRAPVGAHQRDVVRARPGSRAARPRSAARTRAGPRAPPRPSGTAARPAARGRASSCRRRWARAPRRSRPPRP